MNDQEHKSVILDIQGPIAVVTFNRPGKLNAWTPALMSELAATLARVVESHPDIRVLVFAGRGRAFSAGGDMEMFSEGLEVGTLRKLRSDLARIYDIAASAPLVCIAAIQGHCVGSALVLAGCCDFRLCSADAQFHFPEINVGMLPGIGVARITHSMPDRMMRALLIAGRRYNADQALAEGFVSTVVELRDLMPAALALAKEIAAKPGEALSFAKQIATHARLRETRLAHDFESLANHLLLSSDELKNRAKAVFIKSAKSESDR